MSDLIINYKGQSIATLDETGTKTLLTQGKYCEGNIEVAYNKPLLTPYVIRPDAELVGSYSYDKRIVADEGVTIPAYATSAKNLKASANLSPTISVDLANYRYIAVERFLSIPEYSVETKAKGRAEYLWCNYLYEFTRLEANEMATLIDPTKKITSAQILVATSSLYRLLYWTSATAIALYATNGYSIYQTPASPSVSGSTMTVKSPTLSVRGHTTYFTSTFMNALTDIRFQYAIDVYRVPKNSLNLIGWEQDQLLTHMANCINDDDHKLT